MNSIVNIAAYKFVTLDDLKHRRDKFKSLCRRLSLKGTIMLSREGINVFMSGSRGAIDELLQEIRSEPLLSELEVKESFSDYQPFSRLLVKIKKEIIAFGVKGIDPQSKTSRRISPEKLKQWLDEGRAVALLDVRNNHEYEVGTFNDAIGMGIDDFRNFPDAVCNLPDEMKHQTVVTFCTGGIRCEKAGPQLEQQGFTDVYQLDGGILKYFEQCGGEHYHGECFVFDKRVALDSCLLETQTSQCYACQAILTEIDRQSTQFEFGSSCPYCYQSPEQQRQTILTERHFAIQQVTNPLPGSEPYVNIRPIHVTGRFDGYKVIDFLSAIHTHLSYDEWLEICNSRQLQLNGDAIASDEIVRAGQRLQHIMPGTIEPNVNVDIQIMYEDESVVVVNKPAPLPMHPCGRFNRNTLSWILDEVYKPTILRLLHRLDANTSGVVLFSKTRKMAAKIQKQFERGEVVKTYVARVQGQPDTDHFISTTPIDDQPGKTGVRLPKTGGLAARTEFTILKRCADGTTLIEAHPLTGRTNQIRVHLWDIGLPILGDPLYLPDRKLGHSQTLLPGGQPLCLHAMRIEFEHPASLERVTFESSIPTWSEM